MLLYLKVFSLITYNNDSKRSLGKENVCHETLC